MDLPRLYRLVVIHADSTDEWIDFDGNPVTSLAMCTKINDQGQLSFLPPMGLTVGSVDNRFGDDGVALKAACSFSISNLSRQYDRLIQRNLDSGYVMTWIGRRVSVVYGSGDVPGARYTQTGWRRWNTNDALWPGGPTPPSGYPDDEDSYTTVFKGHISTLTYGRDRITFDLRSVAEKLDRIIGTSSGAIGNASAADQVPIVYGDMTDADAFVPVLQAQSDGLPLSSVVVETQATGALDSIHVLDSSQGQTYEVSSPVRYSGDGVISLTTGAKVTATEDAGDGASDKISVFGTYTIGQVWRNDRTGELVAGGADSDSYVYSHRTGDATYDQILGPDEDFRTQRGWFGSERAAVLDGDDFYLEGEDLRQYRLQITFEGTPRMITGHGGRYFLSDEEFNQSGTFGQAAVVASRGSGASFTMPPVPKPDDSDPDGDPVPESWEDLDAVTLWAHNTMAPSFLVSGALPGGFYLPVNADLNADYWVIFGSGYTDPFTVVSPRLDIDFKMPSLSGTLDYLRIRTDRNLYGHAYTDADGWEFTGMQPFWRMIHDGTEYLATSVAPRTGYTDDIDGDIATTLGTMDALRDAQFSIIAEPTTFWPSIDSGGTLVRMHYDGSVWVPTEYVSGIKLYRTYIQGNATVNVTFRDIYAKLDGRPYSTIVEIIGDLLATELAGATNITDLTDGKRDSWEMAGAIVGAKRSYRDILKQLVSEACCVCYTDARGRETLIAPEHDDTATATIVEAQLLQEGNLAQWSQSQWPIGDVYSRFEINYLWDEARDRYAAQVWVDHTGAHPDAYTVMGGLAVQAMIVRCQRAYAIAGANVWQSNLRFIRTSVVAVNHMEWQSYYRTKQRAMVSVGVAIGDAVGVDLGDVLSLTISGLGALSGAAMRVVGIRIDGTRGELDLEEVG